MSENDDENCIDGMKIIHGVTFNYRGAWFARLCMIASASRPGVAENSAVNG